MELIFVLSMLFLLKSVLSKIRRNSVHFLRLKMHKAGSTNNIWRQTDYKMYRENSSSDVQDLSRRFFSSSNSEKHQQREEGNLLAFFGLQNPQAAI